MNTGPARYVTISYQGKIYTTDTEGVFLHGKNIVQASYDNYEIVFNVKSELSDSQLNIMQSMCLMGEEINGLSPTTFLLNPHTSNNTAIEERSTSDIDSEEGYDGDSDSKTDTSFENCDIENQKMDDKEWGNHLTKSSSQFTGIDSSNTWS